MIEVKFVAVVSRISTLADGGIRVVFDLSEDAIMQAAELMTFKRAGVVLDVACTARQGNESDDIGRKQPKY